MFSALNTSLQYVCGFFFPSRLNSCGTKLKNLGIKAEGKGREVLPYMGYIGMCRSEGYGFQAVYSRIGYVKQSVWV